MPKDDSAFTWFCTDMTDILEIFHIAKNQNQLMLHPDLIYLVAMQLKKIHYFSNLLFFKTIKITEKIDTVSIDMHPRKHNVEVICKFWSTHYFKKYIMAQM